MTPDATPSGGGRRAVSIGGWWRRWCLQRAYRRAQREMAMTGTGLIESTGRWWWPYRAVRMRDITAMGNSQGPEMSDWWHSMRKQP